MSKKPSEHLNKKELPQEIIDLISENKGIIEYIFVTKQLLTQVLSKINTYLSRNFDYSFMLFKGSLEPKISLEEGSNIVLTDFYTDVTDSSKAIVVRNLEQGLSKLASNPIIKTLMDINQGHEKFLYNLSLKDSIGIDININGMAISGPDVILVGGIESYGETSPRRSLKLPSIVLHEMVHIAMGILFNGFVQFWIDFIVYHCIIWALNYKRFLCLVLLSLLKNGLSERRAVIYGKGYFLW